MLVIAGINMRHVEGYMTLRTDGTVPEVTAIYS